MLPRAVRFGHILEKSLDSIFYCWLREVLGKKEERFRKESPAKYWQILWNESSYTEFILSKLIRPPGAITLSIRSRSVFKYGVFQLTTRLPEWKNGPMLWFGFEAEDLFGGGVVHFMYKDGKLRAFAGAWPHPLSFELPGLPPDHCTKRHTYGIRVHRNLAFWFIDGRLRGAAVLADGGSLIVLHEGSPYSLGITPTRPASSLAILLDIDGGATDREWVWDDIHPWQLRVLEGDPNPSLLLKLFRYGSEEMLEGRVQAPIASHPIPVAGHRVTLSFEASVKGILRIELSTLKGEWKTFDEHSVEKDRLLHLTLNSSMPFVRLYFEPENEGFVKLAEAYVS